MQKLLDLDISSRRGIMTSHRETAYKMDYSHVALPVTEKASDNSIILPLFVPMTDNDIEKIIATVKDLLQ
jgi:perosamine synthetase